MQDSLTAICTRWHLHDPVPLAQTRTAGLWRVSSLRGDAVVKLLTPAGAGEMAGVRYLEARRSIGAAEVWEVSQTAVLMEWISERSLVGEVQAGRDFAAAPILAHLMNTPPRRMPAGLHTLDDWLAPLTAPQGPVHPAIVPARKVAARLLATTTARRPLHGDLHHENVLNGKRGWAMIDPKGLIGDPGYDVAAAFCNPLGMEALTHREARIGMLGRCFAQVPGQTLRRILDWAYVGTAIPAVWDLDAGLDARATLRLLPMIDRVRTLS